MWREKDTHVISNLHFIFFSLLAEILTKPEYCCVLWVTLIPSCCGTCHKIKIFFFLCNKLGFCPNTSYGYISIAYHSVFYVKDNPSVVNAN